MAGDATGPLVLVTTRSFGAGRLDPERLLHDAGCRVVRGDVGHDPDRLARWLREARAWIAGVAPVGAEHLALAPRLRLVARYGTGVDAVDLEAARDRGVIVTNTPGANADAVADHTLALLLASLRHVVEADRAVRAGHHARYVGRELASLTVGIIGLGNVGRAVARRLRALGALVLGHDPAVGLRDLAPLGVGFRPLEDLLAASDAVSLHCPGGGRPVLDRARLAALPPGAIVVNTARAGLVDEAALSDLLGSGHLGAAAVDLVEGAETPLLTAPRTILTPHIAGHTREAIDRMGLMSVEEVIRVIVGDEPARHAVGACVRTERADRSSSSNDNMLGCP